MISNEKFQNVEVTSAKDLRNNPPSEKNFNSFGDSHKRFTLRWIKLAKTELTRSKRIKKAVELATKDKRIPEI